jgi:hypothetical protein
MLSSPELQAIPHRNRIRALAASAASLLLMNTLTLTVHAERYNEPTVNVVAANAPQIGNVVLTDCLNNPTTCIPEITLPPTTTTLPKPAAVERPVPNKPSRGDAPRLAPESTTTIPLPPITGDKYEWLQQAGMAESDYGDIDYVFTKESGWRPEAKNSRGCIGFGQNCPKNGRTWLSEACPNWMRDPICQIKRFHEYAIGRYKSWREARRHKERTGWW